MTILRAVSRIICGAFALALTLASAPAYASLQVKLDEGVVQPIPIAITDFFGASPSDQKTAAQVAGIVRGDLERSGLFSPVDPHSFIEKISNFGAIPRFGD